MSRARSQLGVLQHAGRKREQSELLLLLSVSCEYFTVQLEGWSCRKVTILFLHCMWCHLHGCTVGQGYVDLRNTILCQVKQLLYIYFIYVFSWPGVQLSFLTFIHFKLIFFYTKYKQLMQCSPMSWDFLERESTVVFIFFWELGFSFETANRIIWRRKSK